MFCAHRAPLLCTTLELNISALCCLGYRGQCWQLALMHERHPNFPALSLPPSAKSLLPLSSIMSSFKDGISLCGVCEQFRNIDRVLLSWEPLDHHRSWTELCKSARQGCQLCKAFMDCHSKEKAPGEATSEDFDRTIGFPASKLTWHRLRRSGPYYLRQDRLFVSRHHDAIDISLDLYVHSGKFQ